MKLTRNFSLSEFTFSETAERLGIPVVIEPDSPEFLAVQRLALLVLQPVRDYFGPVVITSGYRPEALNIAIGGSPNSQHMKGEAADFVVPGYTPLEVCTWIRDADLPFDQLIHEFGRWVHVSIAVDREPRGECLTAFRDPNRRRTVYVPDLVPIPEFA